jgi:probable phosphoglycerate mutase
MIISAKHFYMIRHGQTEANAAQMMAGSLDSPLTALGREQAAIARICVEALEIKPQIIIHSHLSRARETAEIINQNLGLPMIEDADCAEMHVGDWEGKPWEDCLEGFYSGEDPPNGETHQQFIERIIRAKNNALKRTESPPLIVCHGGVFRSFSNIYGLNAENTENCHLHEFIPDPASVSFPWKARSYRMEETLKSMLSASFHSDKASEDGVA